MILLKKRHKKLISKRLYTNISQDELNKLKSVIINDLAEETSKPVNKVKKELENLINITNNVIINHDTVDKNLKNKKYSDQESKPKNEDESLSDSIFTVLRGMIAGTISSSLLSLGVSGLVISIKNSEPNIFVGIFGVIILGTMGIASGNVALEEMYSGLKNISHKLDIKQKVQRYIQRIRNTFSSNKSDKEKQEFIRKVFEELKSNIEDNLELVEDVINNPAVA